MNLGSAFPLECTVGNIRTMIAQRRLILLTTSHLLASWFGKSTTRNSTEQIPQDPSTLNIDPQNL